MINAGEFNRQIDIVRRYKKTDKDGFDTIETEKITSAFAKVNTTRGYTMMTNGTNFEQATTSFLIRKPNVEIRRKDLVQFEGNDWAIEYLNDIDEKHVLVELQCKMVENDNRATGGVNG